MKGFQLVRTCSILAAAAVAPLACSLFSKSQDPNSPQQGSYSANVGANGAPPQQGYPQQQQGYPQQPAPQGYPQQQPQAYPPQPQPGGYPAQPQPAGYPPQPAPGYPPQPAAQPGPAPAGSGGPLAPVATNNPADLSTIFAQAAQGLGAMMQQPGVVPGDLVEAGIKASAALNAQGMQPEGQVAKGNLQQAGHLEFMVPMQAGKCYTLIGFSPPGQIANVDLNLLAPPFYTMLAGQDTTEDNHPVIGKGSNPMCPIVPLPINYKVDIVARKGAGQVGVQLYSKAK